MPWVRFDDQFATHRKVAGLSDAAFRLHVSAIFWCARNLTDGFVPDGDLGDVSARVRTPARFAAECVARAMWHLSGDACGSPKCPANPEKRPDRAGPVDNAASGWLLHDYWEYQFTREQVLRERKAAAQRQKRWREKRNGMRNAVANSVRDATPPRPEGKRGRVTPPPPANGRASPAGPRPPAPSSKPPWCGVCDRETRLTGPPDQPYRCPACHPLNRATRP